MGFKDAVGAICYGGMVVCVITSTIALMAVTSYQCNEVNPWLSYQPGPAGELGDLLYSMPILSGLAFGFLVVALVLEMLGINKLVVLILQIIGAVCFVGAFISEAIWLGFTDHWTHTQRYVSYMLGASIKDIATKDNVLQDAKSNILDYYHNYIKDFLHNSGPKVPELIPNYNLIPTINADGMNGLVNNYFEIANLISTVFQQNVPACYYENADKAKNFEDAVDCIGKWSPGKLKSYYETMKKRAEDEIKKKEDEEKEEDDNQNDREKIYSLYAKWSKRSSDNARDRAFYYKGAKSVVGDYESYFFHSYNIGVMAMAIIFTILYFVFGCLGFAKVGA